MGGDCLPAYDWENRLRQAAGQTTYSGGFIARLLHDAMFFEAEPWVFTVGYSLFGLAVLATFALAPPRIPERFRRRHANISG